MRHIVVNLTDDLAERLRREAALRRATASEAITQVLEEHLAGQPLPARKPR
ncbi:MAG: hypothetical protein ACRDXX_01485 [Stackebrandtia sp.]